MQPRRCNIGKDFLNNFKNHIKDSVFSELNDLADLFP